MTPIRMVIVEDDPMVVEITQEFIKDCRGFEVAGVAHTGQEAVELVAKLKPQLVLLDNFLPDFNGTAVIGKIRAVVKEIDFIMITAAKEVPVVQECLRLGVRDYLIKPFLKQRLQQALQNYREFLETLNQPQVSQDDLDRLGSGGTVCETQCAKGFSPLTEEKIIEVMKKNPQGVTAELIATEVGITTVSARRYLKLMQDKNQVRFDLIYGKQGRPTYMYKMN